MPRKKKSKAAKVRINKQIRSNKGQFIIDEDEYKPSDDYSEDSLDDEFINKRINKLNNFTLVWSNTNDIHKKTRKPYTGNSKVTKYRKYGLSGDFTKAAKLTQPITNFFQIKNIDDELENIENYNEMFEDNENDNGMENTETGDENDDGMRNIESGDESDDESDDKNDDETEDENDNEMDDNDNNDDDEINDSDDEINANDMEKNEDNSFDSKLINLEKILSGNLKKISAYDYLRYRAIHVFFKG